MRQYPMLIGKWSKSKRQDLKLINLLLKTRQYLNHNFIYQRQYIKRDCMRSNNNNQLMPFEN